MALHTFSKMHGIGNDFVILDQRHDPVALTPERCRWLADRQRGIGCDQILAIVPVSHSSADGAYRIWNADGSEARQCGNGARCVAAWLLRDGTVAAGQVMHLESPTGLHRAQGHADGQIEVVMGIPEFAPRAVPFLGFEHVQDAYELNVPDFGAVQLGAVSMGNPHAVIEVTDVAGLDIAPLARAVQAHPRFPDSVNVGFVQVLSPDEIRLRVYERGVGETLACGSGACAAAVVLMERGRVNRSVKVHLPGGTLQVSWAKHGQSVWMTGPATFVFEGAFDFEGSGL